MSLAVIGLAQVAPLRLQAEGVAVQDAGLAGFELDPLRDDLRDGPGLSAAASSSLRSWRTVSVVELLLVLQEAPSCGR